MLGKGFSSDMWKLPLSGMDFFWCMHTRHFLSYSALYDWTWGETRKIGEEKGFGFGNILEVQVVSHSSRTICKGHQLYIPTMQG